MPQASIFIVIVQLIWYFRKHSRHTGVVRFLEKCFTRKNGLRQKYWFTLKPFLRQTFFLRQYFEKCAL